MAGDWIKMRVDLGDDPAVVQIAERLNKTEDEAVGKLHRLWSWADKHTTDGTAPAITARWVDRYVGCPGFAEAMSLAGWISFSDAGVLFPSFDRHNGESAKRRGEASIRQRLSRQNRDEGVTGESRSAIPRPFIRHVMDRDAHTCVYCGKESTAAQEASRKAILSVDHIKPITRGGSAAVENLACCCRLCNREKNDRTPEEWGLNPTFLSPGVIYQGGQLVSDVSQKNRDKDVTREEKRREDELGDKSPLSADKLPTCPHETLIDLFGQHLPTLPQPKKELWDGKNAEAMRTRWRWVLSAKKKNGDRYATTKEEAVDWFGRFFAYVATSEFLSGANGKWTGCDLGWLMKADNFAKVVQGNYDTKGAQ